MRIGKLDNALLKKIVFDHIKFKRKEVMVRPGVGEDCAVIDYGENVCVMSTDPITGAESEVGKLAVHISCNDIASSGVEPLGIMLAIMVPECTTEEQLENIMKQAADEAEKLNVEIIGGHTEITNAVNKPIIVSTAIGKKLKSKFIKKKPISIGDAIVMTKYAGLEGAGIIASDCASDLKQYLTEDEIISSCQMLNHLSVVPEGIIAGDLGASIMHDITEGGVLGAVWEICESAGIGAEVEYEKIPASPETIKICNIYHLDYLKLISSGCMMMIISQEKKQELLNAFNKENIPAAEIGIVTEKGKYIVKNGRKIEIQPPESDELYKAVHS